MMHVSANGTTRRHVNEPADDKLSVQGSSLPHPMQAQATSFPVDKRQHHSIITKPPVLTARDVFITREVA